MPAGKLQAYEALVCHTYIQGMPGSRELQQQELGGGGRGEQAELGEESRQHRCPRGVRALWKIGTVAGEKTF